MKFEKLSSDKFKAFKQHEITNLTAIVGGFPGETGTQGSGGCSGGDTDQTQSDGTTKTTCDGSGKADDGFKVFE